ncbi:MAG: hypothetical protein A2289_09425 [Deltaproteobacteria bacterium RIFOXYA12_FULL_58_15]|nr:MAG: hypothetical protein A2289_09425 [Deltaproteobacteria bacterium RIFOXYA12_FULL_58_15]
MPTLVVCAALVIGAPATDELLKKDVFVVEAELVEMPGTPPPNDLYDYAFVMKYVVKNGEKKGETIYVAHFNPRQKRKDVRDDMRRFVAGALSRFKVGDTHTMKLSPHLDEIWSNALEDNTDAGRKTPRYWCLEVNLAK